MGWTVGVSAFVIFPLHQKMQNMCKNMTVGPLGINPWVPPYAYANKRWGNPARTQHNSALRHTVRQELC